MTNKYCFDFPTKQRCFVDEASEKKKIHPKFTFVLGQAFAFWRHIMKIDLTGLFLDDITSYC